MMKPKVQPRLGKQWIGLLIANSFWVSSNIDDSENCFIPSFQAASSSTKNGPARRPFANCFFATHDAHAFRARGEVSEILGTVRTDLDGRWSCWSTVDQKTWKTGSVCIWSIENHDRCDRGEETPDTWDLSAPCFVSAALRFASTSLRCRPASHRLWWRICCDMWHRNARFTSQSGVPRPRWNGQTRFTRNAWHAWCCFWWSCIAVAYFAQTCSNLQLWTCECSAFGSEIRDKETFETCKTHQQNWPNCHGVLNFEPVPFTSLGAHLLSAGRFPTFALPRRWLSTWKRSEKSTGYLKENTERWPGFKFSDENEDYVDILGCSRCCVSILHHVFLESSSGQRSFDRKLNQFFRYLQIIIFRYLQPLCLRDVKSLKLVVSCCFQVRFRCRHINMTKVPLESNPDMLNDFARKVPSRCFKQLWTSYKTLQYHTTSHYTSFWYPLIWIRVSNFTKRFWDLRFDPGGSSAWLRVCGCLQCAELHFVKSIACCAVCVGNGRCSADLAHRALPSRRWISTLHIPSHQNYGSDLGTWEQSDPYSFAKLPCIWLWIMSSAS